MALEALEQMDAPPTHLFLQAGVGSMAAAVTAFFCAAFPQNPPKIIVVEPSGANCLFQSAQNPNGKRQFVTRAMNTIMAGLACGEPNPLAWPILRNYAGWFFSIPDEIAALGIRVLGALMAGDRPICSGESGAAPLGCAVELLRSSDYQEFCRDMDLNSHSRLLFFSTEGDTDAVNYRKILWDGAFYSGR